MIKGDTPEAVCFNSPEETDYRTPPHGWRAIKNMQILVAAIVQEKPIRVEVCDACGAMRKIDQ